MESLNFLNLRVDECSFLEIALTDVRRFIEHFGSENKKQVVLIFPPLSARNRFLIHTLVQHFFDELNTISIGSSYGRRTVVYHSSLKPMLHETESEESNEIQNEKNYVMHQAYRTPVERKAQEQLFKSLMPRKNVDKSSRSNQNKKSKRPDIPIYVPRALRGLAKSTAPNTCSTSPNISSTDNSSNSTLSTECDIDYKIQDPSRNTLCSIERKGSFSQSNLNNEINSTLPSLDLLLSVDTPKKMLVDCRANNESQNSFENISPENSVSLSSNDLSNCINPKECNLNSSVSNEVVKPKSPLLESDGIDSYIVEKSLKNCDNVSISLDLPMCLSDNLNDVCTQNSKLDKLPAFQIPCSGSKMTSDVRKSWTIRQSMALHVIDNIETIIEENLLDKSEKQNHEINLGNESVDTEISDVSIETGYQPICPNSSFDDSFRSCQLMEVEEKNINNVNEEVTVQANLGFVNKSLNNVEQNVQKKKKKKKVLDLEECSWEDLYDKDDDYIHPILMKELASTMGKVQVQCAKEDYRNHQTIEERSGDGDCVIELYGFSSDLKTIDLMNQFASFRKNHFDIVWVNDTHALAVFENPNLADRALNTPLALVKTRPLKNAIKESKLKAETVAPPPAIRPRTCTAMARRLVSSALGLKVDVSPNLLSAERTILADAKDKKIRDNQQKNDIWDSESF